MGVGGLIEKLGNWLFLFENGWEWVVFVKIRVGMCRFCRKIGGSGLLFLKNGWEWVTFLEKGENRLYLLKNEWEWVAVVEK